MFGRVTAFISASERQIIDALIFNWDARDAGNECGENKHAGNIRKEEQIQRNR